MTPDKPIKKPSEPAIPLYRFQEGDYVPEEDVVIEEELDEGDGGPEPEPEVRMEVTERRVEADGRRVVITKTSSRADELFMVRMTILILRVQLFKVYL